MNFKRRKIYIINKPFQLKMLIVSFLATGPVVSLFYFAYSYLMNSLLERLEFMDKNVAGTWIAIVGDIEEKMKLVLLVGLFVTIFLNAIFFLLLSHAIAGPIEKLKNHLRQKALKAETGPFLIRSTDFFPELPEVVNAVFNDSVPSETKQVNT